METGMGKCFVPNDQGIPCAGQIEEGSPVGTVMLVTGPAVGHKKCCDGHYARKIQQERENRENLVKLAKQNGPGGVTDLTNAEDAIENPSPLVKSELVADNPVSLLPGTNSAPIRPVVPELMGLSDDELAKLEEYKQKLIGSRVQLSAATAVTELLPKFWQVVNELANAAGHLTREYNKVVAERDEARSERDTARTTGSSTP
jgi:hypothetical protein